MSAVVSTKMSVQSVVASKLKVAIVKVQETKERRDFRLVCDTSCGKVFLTNHELYQKKKKYGATTLTTFYYRNF